MRVQSVSKHDPKSQAGKQCGSIRRRALRVGVHESGAGASGSSNAGYRDNASCAWSCLCGIPQSGGASGVLPLPAGGNLRIYHTDFPLNDYCSRVRDPSLYAERITESSNGDEVMVAVIVIVTVFN
ncbi:hypothetical protein E2C01_019102 [Portunus trituberculatus]|uniref:Uncharacterized protein n=1 Tax=Portunus trituberculatus TaxID=210409 RepID=A0A5B7DY99_PORTR|nr:hypothetical protein [Portunus trituberculatus]